MGTWAWSLGWEKLMAVARGGEKVTLGTQGLLVGCDLSVNTKHSLCSNNFPSHGETVYHGNNVKYYAGGFKFLTLFITW